MRARDADGLHVAMMRLARKRMMDSLSNAIERFESKYDWDSFNGRYWHFRWAKDWQIYHWRDFEEFYGEHCDFEWSHAQELLSSDEAFIIPAFLLRTVKKRSFESCARKKGFQVGKGLSDLSLA